MTRLPLRRERAPSRASRSSRPVAREVDSSMHSRPERRRDPLSTALDILSRRDHSEAELARKLRSRGSTRGRSTASSHVSGNSATWMTAALPAAWRSLPWLRGRWWERGSGSSCAAGGFRRNWPKRPWPRRRPVATSGPWSETCWPGNFPASIRLWRTLAKSGGWWAGSSVAGSGSVPFLKRSGVPSMNDGTAPYEEIDHTILQ